MFNEKSRITVTLLCERCIVPGAMAKTAAWGSFGASVDSARHGNIGGKGILMLLIDW